MRNNFVSEVTRFFSEERGCTSCFLTGDLGYSVLDELLAAYPQRVVNAGIAEQNMMGVATGLASLGRRTFCYSIVNFVTFRCLEQIKNGPCYHNLPVSIVSVGAGASYNHYGYTHMGIEDISILRPLPNLRIYSPADRHELATCFSLMVEYNGPAYLRLGKGGEPDLHNAPLAARNGMACLRDGEKVALISTGPVTVEAVRAVDSLRADGFRPALFSWYDLSKDLLQEMVFSTFASVVVVEEHVPKGGLYGMVAESGYRNGYAGRVLSLGLSHETLYEPWSQPTIRRMNSIDADGIAGVVKLLMNG
ncbi:MAG: transketolase [Planctomycetes bacterium]|nr:transketolase [Planctomycetota bacterium]